MIHIKGIACTYASIIRPRLEYCLYRLGVHDLWKDIDTFGKRQMRATKLIPGPRDLRQEEIIKNNVV